MRKLFIISLLLLCAATGCGTKHTNSSGKEEISLLCADGGGCLQEIIVDFNKQSENYEVVLERPEFVEIDFVKSYVNTRVVSKDSPDLIMSSYFSFEGFMDEGIVEDLSSYLQKSTVVREEQYIDAVIAPFKKDQAIYGIPSDFSVASLGCRSNNIKNEEGWDIDEFLTYLEKHPEVEFEWDGNQYGILKHCLQYGVESFVDFKTKSCNFDGEEFKGLLKRIKELERPDYSYCEAWADLLQEGTDVIFDYYITDFFEVQKKEATLGENIKIVGYPSADGSRKSCLTPNNIIGIVSNGKNKEGAWDFLEFYISHLDSYFEKQLEFPANEQLFQEKLQLAMEKNIMINEQGDEVVLPKTYATSGVEVIPVYELSQEQADRLMDIIEESVAFPQWKNKMILLILDEAHDYLNQSKTLEEVTKIIQSRAEIYLKEYML